MFLIPSDSCTGTKILKERVYRLTTATADGAEANTIRPNVDIDGDEQTGLTESKAIENILEGAKHKVQYDTKDRLKNLD